MKLKLQKITTSTTQNVFHISVQKDNDNKPRHIAFLSDIEQQDDFEPLHDSGLVKYNKNSLYSKSDDSTVVYYNMYDSTTPRYRSPFYKKPRTQLSGMTYDFQNVVNHKLSSHILNSVLSLNVIYMLEPNTEYGHSTVSADIISWLSSDTGRSDIPTKRIQTAIYDRDKLEDNMKNNILSSSSISVNLENVKYNMIYEMPGNIYNDYESGNIISHVFKGKNQYDCEYNMLHCDGKVLSCIRSYTDIDCCNTQLYLKYSNKDYIETKDSSQIHKKDNVTYNKYKIWLPSIEVIRQINRTNNADQHNTELYSINIDVRQMFSLMVDPTEEKQIDMYKVKDNVKNEIRNCVRAIAESILPANVQLFHVYVNGE